MSLKDKLMEGIWNVGVIDASIDEIMQGNAYSIRWMKHHYHDRFFADPFLYNEDSEEYKILAEEYKFYDRIGRIVLLTIKKKNMKLVKKEYVIKEPYHLSYPNYENGVIIPESYKSGSLYSYSVNGKTLKKRSIADYPLIDPTFVTYNGRAWLFATTRESEPMDAQRRLSIFYLQDGKYIPHKNNPIKVDIKTSRPGGKFFEYENKLYRPAQNCTHFYGEDIRIMKVLRLDVDSYEEEEFMTIKTDITSKYKGLHTFNIAKNTVIVDGYYESTTLMKIIYIKMKKLYSFFDKDKRDKGFLINL